MGLMGFTSLFGNNAKKTKEYLNGDRIHLISVIRGEGADTTIGGEDFCVEFFATFQLQQRVFGHCYYIQSDYDVESCLKAFSHMDVKVNADLNGKRVNECIGNTGDLTELMKDHGDNYEIVAQDICSLISGMVQYSRFGNLLYI